MRREFGGCAGNIAYALNLLGGDARIMAHARRSRRAALHRPVRRSSVCRRSTCASCRTAYYGAGDDHHRSGEQPDHRVPPGRDDAVAPEPRRRGQGHHARHRRAGRLRRHASSTPSSLAAAGVPFIFDPGQGLPLFDGAALRRMIELATYVAVNDYEAKLVSNKTGWSVEEIAEQGRGADRHARRARRADPSCGRHRRNSGGQGTASASIRPVAATRSAAVCCTASRTSSAGPPPGVSPA